MASLQQQNSLAGPNSGALAQDPITYQKLQEAFLKDLRHFHDTKGTSFRHNPKISGKEVDLYKLYTLVTSRGGWIQVNAKNEWSWLCEEFHLPDGCVNSGVGLKQIYLRYLDKYEKIHYLGEDGHHANDDDDDSSRHRKFNVRSLNSVPSTYNHNQHNVADSLREYNGLSSDLYKPSNYDKLALSLLSPLPNEQDFAINVCTFLSNEGRHTLRLDKYPRLITHLLAHAGVYDSPGTRQLFIECYSRVRNYSINSFWQDVLDAQDVLDLTDERVFINKQQHQDSQTQESIARFIRRRRDRKNKENNNEPMEVVQETPTPCERRLEETEVLAIDETSTSSSTSSSGFRDQNQNSIKFEDDDKDLFCVGRTLGTQDPYGQRVLQIASILRNLSFSPENAVVLGKSRSFLRFVLLCVRARWSNLHQLGFDILGNIANEIVLKEAGERLTNVVLQSVTKGIDSPDRFVVISCLEILNKISQQDANEETVALSLDDHVYEVICRFLALSDIALLVYTLECLYALTSMGERPCTSVSRVRGAIDTLVALVTVEAQSYGPKACILMRVVETVSSVPAQQPEPSQATVATPAQDSLPAWRRTSTVHPSPTGSTTQSSSSVFSSSAQQISSPAVATAAASPVQAQANLSQTPQKQIVLQTQATAPTSQIKVLQQTPQQKQQPQLQQMQSASQPTQPSQQQTTVTATNVVPKTATGSSNSRPGTPKNATAAAKAANTLQMQHTHQQIIQENEQFALGWLKANFELSPGIKIEQEELYKKYLGCCTKIGRRGVIAPIHFPRCVRSVFGSTIGPNPIKGEVVGPMFYEGIKIRANPGPISYPGSQSSSTTTATTSSSNGNTSSNNPKVTVAHPHLSQALLNQQAQGQVQTVQVIVKEDPRSATSSSIIKSLLATKVTPGDSSNSANNQILTASQVAQRQQQQRQQQQQQQQQQQAPTKTYSNAKQKQTIIAVKKVQRLNGAKVVVGTNNGDNPENNLTATQLAVASITPEAKRTNVPTSVVEDSDSTKDSQASSSGIGGSREAAEEDNSLTSFEGILLNGAPSTLDIDAQEEDSKDRQGTMLADLLERKTDKLEPVLNGVVGKKNVVLVNHVKKVKSEDPDTIEQTLQSLKRPSTDEPTADDVSEPKKLKFANGTSSPDPSDSTAVSSVKSEEADDEKDEKVTVSSTAANLYAALAADLIDDEIDEPMEETIKEEIKTEIKEEIKEEPAAQLPVVSMNQIVLNQQQVQVQQQSAPAPATTTPQQVSISPQLQQQLLVGGRQIVVQQNNQVLAIPAQALKGKTGQPQVLQVQQGQGGQQTHYVISGGVGGQNYVLAQPQTGIMQGSGQTVLVAQQQGTNAKTIIILQPQSTGQQQQQKVLVTPQGQQVVVTQVPRPVLQTSAISSVPPPLVSTSNPGSIVVGNAIQTSQPVRVVTPTPSTPPPTRPATPQQAVQVSATKSKDAAGKELPKKEPSKPSTSQETTDSTSSRPQTPNKSAGDAAGGGAPAQTPKTITIKIDPNLFLCEWRGCLKQFKTPRKVFMHVCEAHCPTGTDESLCLWSSCDSLKRRRFSLMTHLYDRHCCDDIMVTRRKQLTSSGKTEITTTTATPTTHHPGYAPNAALHAIKRHALEFVNPKELMQRPSKPAAAANATNSSSSPRLPAGQNPPPEQDDNEGPVTKSIRLTAALILRNLVIYSAHGRRHLRAYEPHLAGVALSNVESSRTIAQVLYDMNDQGSSGHR